MDFPFVGCVKRKTAVLSMLKNKCHFCTGCVAAKKLKKRNNLMEMNAFLSKFQQIKYISNLCEVLGIILVSGSTLTPRRRPAVQTMTYRTASLPRISSQPSSTNNSPNTSPKMPRAADRRPSLGGSDDKHSRNKSAAVSTSRDVRLLLFHWGSLSINNFGIFYFTKPPENIVFLNRFAML